MLIMNWVLIPTETWMNLKIAMLSEEGGREGALREGGSEGAQSERGSEGSSE